MALGELANEMGVSTTSLSVAWSKQNDFVGSTIIGVNSVAQPEEILPASEIEIDESVMSRIDEISKEFAYPMG